MCTMVPWYVPDIAIVDHLLSSAINTTRRVVLLEDLPAIAIPAALRIVLVLLPPPLVVFCAGAFILFLTQSSRPPPSRPGFSAMP
jgi:hypothetical protein